MEVCKIIILKYDGSTMVLLRKDSEIWTIIKWSSYTHVYKKKNCNLEQFAW